MKRNMFGLSVILALLFYANPAISKPERLNNVVTRLIDISNPKTGKVYKFELANLHFVWIRLDCKLFSYANVKVFIDDKKKIIEGNARKFPNFAYDLPEAMIYLSAGKHKVRIIANDFYKMDRLRVHLVPEIHDYVYVEDLAYLYNRDSYRAFRWNWAKVHGLLNYNTIVTMKPYKDKSALPVWQEHLREWKASGRQVILNGGMTGRNKESLDKLTEISYRSWKKVLSNSLYDGIILDELGRNKWTFDRLPYWLKAAEKLTSEYKEKKIIFFSFTSYEPKEDELLKTIPNMDRVFLAPEHYFPENQMNEFDSWSGENMKKWKAISPEIQKKCIIYLSSGNASTYAGYDTMYDTDYKAFLDRYVKYFAVDGKCFNGIAGIGFWKFNFLDEETYPFIAALMRHYCILGRTNLFYDSPVKLTHIKNGSFEDKNIKPWKIECNNPETAKLVDLPIDKSTSWLRVPFGQKGLYVKPTANIIISQEVRNLNPDKIYQAECYAFSVKRKAIYPVKIKLANAKILHSCIEVSTKRRCIKKINGKKTKELQTSYWNRYRVVFKPKAENSEISIVINSTNGNSATKIDEFYIDFVQVQPYFTGSPYYE